MAVLVALGVGVVHWLSGRGAAAPVPGQQRCVATANGRSVAVDLDQAHFASIIVGLSVRRGLAPRAASIAMATVYQESGIRNLDYGDRDSVGLFQQRPSQGWGSEKQLMDPYYATGKFYDALVRVDGWRTGDITEVAQKVQRSGYPDAYRDHEADARVLASTLTGQSHAAFTCLDRSGTAGDGSKLAAALRRTFGSVRLDVEGSTVTVSAEKIDTAWAYAQFAVANAKYYGVTAVQVEDRQWQTQNINLPTWTAASPSVGTRTVRISMR